MKRLLLTIATVMAIMASEPGIAFAQGSWVGETILVKKNRIKIGHTDSQGRQVYVGVLDGAGYTVLGDQAGWLLVKDRRGAEGWFDKADAVLLKSAVAYFTGLIRQNPANEAAYDRRAIAWMLKGELEIAIMDFGEAIRLNPTGAGLYNNRGNAWLRKKEYDRAIADYNEAIRLEPFETGYYNRGIAWVGKKDYDRAIADYSEAIRLDPKYVVAFNSRGNAWLQKKEYDKAIADYSEAIRLDPKYVAVFNNRGFAWNKRRDYEKAIRDFSQAIKVDAGYADAYNRLAWLLATCPDARFRDGNLAIEVALQSCKLTNWKDGNCVDTLAAGYAEAGQFDKATHYQEMALTDSSYVRLSGLGARQRLELYQQQKAYRE